MKNDQNYCSYYQARVIKEKCWFMVATLRSFEHIAFDRTVDKDNSIFEFFVPVGLESHFLDVMAHYKATGLITTLDKLPNRLAEDQ